MAHTKQRKVLVPRPSKVTTDGQGRSVWVDPVESANLELISTQALEQALRSNDPRCRESIERAAEYSGDGVLARDPASGDFEVIDDEDLREILKAQADLPKRQRPAEVTLEPLSEEAEDAVDELSLVSTQKLRTILGKPEPEDSLDDVDDPGAGRSFNPYDSG